MPFIEVKRAYDSTLQRQHDLDPSEEQITTAREVFQTPMRNLIGAAGEKPTRMGLCDRLQ